MIAGPGTIATTILYVDIATPKILDLFAHINGFIK
jgi:hypothetical protein